MGVVSARFRFRPVRIGWCVEQDDIDSLRRAIKFSFCFWGGNFFPIIPFENKELADLLIRRFKIDLLFPLNRSNSKALNFIENYQYIKWPLIHSALFEPRMGGGVSPNFLDINFPSAELSKNNIRKSLNLTSLVQENDDPLMDILSIDFGVFPEENEIRIDYKKQLEKYFDIIHRKVSKDDNVHADRDRYNISKISKSFLFADHFHYTWFQGYYLGKVNSFDDLVNYWNLKASNINVKFFDQDYIYRFESINKSIEELNKRNSEDEFARPHYITLWYDSEKTNEFNGIVKYIKLDSNFWEDFNQATFYFESKNIIGHKSETSNILDFPISGIPKLSNNSFSNLVIDFSVNNHVSFQEEYIYNVPYIPELNRRNGSSLSIKSLAFRAGSEYDGVIERAQIDKLTIFPLRTEELIKNIFSLVDLKISISKPGLIAKQIINQFKGLPLCKIFRIEGVRKLINKYSAYEEIRKTEIIKCICNEDYSMKHHLFLREFTSEEIFNELINLKIYRVGIVIDCPTCNLDFWKSIDDIQSVLSCEYCGNEINILIQLKDRDWFYRKTGILSESNHQEGAIPTILTILKLNDSLDRGKNIYFPSFEITNANNKRIIDRKIEIDFIYINQVINNLPNIIIGECKSYNNFDQNDLMNLIKLKNILETKELNVFILLSKLSELNEDEQNLLRNFENEIKNRLIIFSKDELEEDFLFHKKSETHDLINIQ